jgi:DNA-binding response OmpR family regulator
MAHVIIVDNDSLSAQSVRNALQGARHRVEVLPDGYSAMRMLRRTTPDLIVLEAELPDQSGYDLCRRIRRDSNVGIVFLSRLGGAEHRVKGLQQGADDYLAKPWAPSELLARINAVLRRSGQMQQPTTDVLTTSSLVLDPVRQIAIRHHQPATDLTPRESHVLSYLMQRAGKVCPTQQIATHIWGHSDRQSRNIVATSVWRLRTKLERDPQNPRHIVTIRSVGYKFEP